LDWIRSSGNRIPFILLTEKSQDDLAIRALNLGADYYLEKNKDDEESLFLELAQHIEDAVKEKRVRDALRTSEAHFRAVFEQSGMGMAQVSMDGRILLVNDALVNLLGYSREELLQMSVDEISHPDDMIKDRELTEELVSGLRLHYQMEKRFYHIDGGIIWGNISVSLIRDSSGNPQFVYGMLQDITEMKYIQNRLQEQHKFLTNILESLTHPFYVINAADYTVTMANSAARLGPMTGSETCYSLTHGKDTPCTGDEHPCPLEEVKRKRAPLTVEHEHFDIYGNVRIFEIHAFPLFDTEGKVSQIIEYNLDVTEQRRSEKIALQERDRAQSYLEIAGTMIIAFDEHLRITMINQKGCEILGYTEQEAIGMNWIDSFIPDRKKEEIRNYMLGILNGIEMPTEDNEGLVQTVSEEEKIIEWTDVVLRDKDGNAIGILSAGPDVTERNRIEKALEKSEEIYRTLVQSMSEEIFVFNGSDNFIQYHGSSSDELYLEPDRLLGKHVADVLPDRLVGIYNDVAKSVRDTSKGHTFEFSLEMDGEERWYSATGSLHVDGSSIIFTVRPINIQPKVQELEN
jgi:PAS domain S-box-containing protein